MTEAESDDEHDGRTSGGPAAETDKDREKREGEVDGRKARSRRRG